MGDNFWGDMDGDGDADRWDDVIGDGLLMDTMRAEEKRRRGKPLTRDEAEWLGVDYREYPAPRRSAGHAPSPPVAHDPLTVVLVCIGFVLFAFLCMLMSL